MKKYTAIITQGCKYKIEYKVSSKNDGNILFYYKNELYYKLQINKEHLAGSVIRFLPKGKVSVFVDSDDMTINDFIITKSNDDTSTLLIYDKYTSHDLFYNSQLLQNKLGCEIRSAKYMSAITNHDTIIFLNTSVEITKKTSRCIYVCHTLYHLINNKEIIQKNDRMIDEYIFTSSALKVEFLDKIINTEKKCVVIENKPHEECMSANNMASYNTFVAVGPFNVTSNYFSLIKEFKTFFTTNKDATLTIYGDIKNDYCNNLKDFVKSLFIDGAVKIVCSNLVNYISAIEKTEYFCDFGVSENYNIHLLDAMKLNKKIICKNEKFFGHFDIYPNKTNGFPECSYVKKQFKSPDVCLTDQYRSLLNYTNIKTYVGKQNVFHTDNHLDDNKINKILEDEIMHGLHIKLEKGLSFLLRIKNEERDIMKNIFSIYDHADEIIIINNGSTDNTKKICDYFDNNYKKVYVYDYNIEINEVTKNEGKYYKLIGTYYNWGLSKVTKYNVVKWDGDFVAIEPNLKTMIDKYNLKNRDDKFALWFSGITCFYNKYVNISSYYDEYRCFSKLHGFVWTDNKICETSKMHVMSCGVRLVNGYDNTNNLLSIDNGFDLKTMPIFYEQKNFNDFKQIILDNRCENDNAILMTYLNKDHTMPEEKPILFMCMTNFDDYAEYNELFNEYVSYFGNDVRYVAKRMNSNDNKTYCDISYFKKNLGLFCESDVKIFVLRDVFSREEIETIQKKYKNVKFYGFVYSEGLQHNDYFVNNSYLFEKIIVGCDTVHNKFIKNNITNVELIHNTLPLEKHTHKKIFNSKEIKLVCLSGLSNLVMLMTSINKLRNYGINITLDIYSEETKDIKIIHEKMKHKKFIVFHGQNENNSNKKDIYSKYDMCIIPSISNNNIFNILEAINYEIPLLSTNTESNNEIINYMLPGFNFHKLEEFNGDNTKSVGYDINNSTLNILDQNVYDKNVYEITNKILYAIENYHTLKKNVIRTRENIKNKFFDEKLCVRKLQNLLFKSYEVIM